MTAPAQGLGRYRRARGGGAPIKVKICQLPGRRAGRELNFQPSSQEPFVRPVEAAGAGLSPLWRNIENLTACPHHGAGCHGRSFLLDPGRSNLSHFDRDERTFMHLIGTLQYRTQHLR
jgi:hypothetical protein